jgi:hypothetical protein
MSALPPLTRLGAQPSIGGFLDELLPAALQRHVREQLAVDPAWCRRIAFFVEVKLQFDETGGFEDAVAYSSSSYRVRVSGDRNAMGRHPEPFTAADRAEFAQRLGGVLQLFEAPALRRWFVIIIERHRRSIDTPPGPPTRANTHLHPAVGSPEEVYVQTPDEVTAEMTRLFATAISPAMRTWMLSKVRPSYGRADEGDLVERIVGHRPVAGKRYALYVHEDLRATDRTCVALRDARDAEM